jgi:CDP-paratose 2-epimerase
MKVLITGIAGFTGCWLARNLLIQLPHVQILGIDNLSRKGAEKNIEFLKELDIYLIRGDIRYQSDIGTIPPCDWVIDCAATPSVQAGIDGKSSSRQLLENNLWGTVNLLEYCKKFKAGLILLSTSRVYSASELALLPIKSSNDRFELIGSNQKGLSKNGITENFPTTAPISLYGASKLASETLILEYGKCFDFPVWINRCGVLAGAAQFGKADQGIFSYWIHSFREKNTLKYIGFDGTGHQVRDALHPKDLVPLLTQQILEPNKDAPKIINLGGGIKNSLSLKQLSQWCVSRFGVNEVVISKEVRPMDAPWIVMDSSVAMKAWGWNVQTNIEQILEEIANHAEQNPGWLNLSK